MRRTVSVIWRRRPDVGLVRHSDRGGQHVSLIFGQTARAAGIAVSMRTKGCALDNAVCEAFFATLKKELTRLWPTRRDLQRRQFASLCRLNDAHWEPIVGHPAKNLG